MHSAHTHWAYISCVWDFHSFAVRWSLSTFDWWFNLRYYPQFSERLGWMAVEGTLHSFFANYSSQNEVRISYVYWKKKTEIWRIRFCLFNLAVWVQGTWYNYIVELYVYVSVNWGVWQLCDTYMLSTMRCLYLFFNHRIRPHKSSWLKFRATMQMTRFSGNTLTVSVSLSFIWFRRRIHVFAICRKLLCTLGSSGKCKHAKLL